MAEWTLIWEMLAHIIKIISFIQSSYFFLLFYFYNIHLRYVNGMNEQGMLLSMIPAGSTGPGFN